MATNTDNKQKGAPEVDLERLFQELDGEGSVAVSRKEPDWAKGHIRTVQASPAQPISMDWLTKQFGGEKLQVRVYASDGRTMIGSRSVEICAPPRDGNGIELVRGPEGNAVPVNRLEAEKKRYNSLHGLPDSTVNPEPVPPAAPAAGLDLSSILQTMISSQNNTNNTMTTMLIQRINSLENLLTKQLLQPPGAGAAVAQVEPADPLGNLTNVVDVIGKLDKVKEKMGISDREPASEAAGYIDLIKGFMEMHLETKKAQAAQAAQPAQLPAAPQAPVLPGPAGVEQPIAEPQNPAQMDDQALFLALSQRMPAILENLPPEKRKSLAEQVLGEQILTDDDWEDDPPEAENEIEDGQRPENVLNLDQTKGETGADTSDQGSCISPEKSADPHTDLEH